MPIYMYRCGECQQTCEALQHSTDAPLLECPACHSLALHKIIAPVGIIFKGHGFYKTDNVSGSSGAGHHREDVPQDKASRTEGTGGNSVEGSAPSVAKSEVAHDASGEKPAKSADPASASSGVSTQSSASVSGKVAS